MQADSARTVRSPRVQRVTPVSADSPINAVDHSRRTFWLRLLLAGPVVLACATLVMAGGAIWLPKGAAQIDNLLPPILLFPAIWASLFFYACLAPKLGRAYGVTAIVALLQLAMIGDRKSTRLNSSH